MKKTLEEINEDLIKNTIRVDNNKNKTYQNGKKLSDFFENKTMFGMAITKGNKVLFAKNYKSFNKAKEAYETAIAMCKVYNYKPDNELTFCIWNGMWSFNEYCLLTEDYSKKCDEMAFKWYKFLDNYITIEDKKEIKEIRFNKKNYELISRKGCINYLNGYPLIIDDTVTEDFKVIYESENK